MQAIATSEQMHSLDDAAIRRYAVPGIALMENAGRAVAEESVRMLRSVEDPHVLIVCGKGNNGGDGFVAARHLTNMGLSVSVRLVGKRSRVRGEAKANLQAVLKLAREKENRLDFDEIVSARRLTGRRKPDLIIDALLGTGFTGTLKAPERGIVSAMNASGCHILAVDIPSGVDATTGTVGGEAVNAEKTVTFALGKIGQYVGDGRDRSGEVLIVDIGIPRHLTARLALAVHRVDGEDVRRALPHRGLRAHKHSVGKILVVAGSRDFTGAPFMCTQSALRAGAGSVVLAVPESLHFILARKLTEAMVHPLPETSEGTMASGAFDALVPRIEWADVVILGPGLSRNAETADLVHRLIPRIRKPLILDADGLVGLGKKPALVRNRKMPTILTPHTGELAGISCRKSQAIEAARIEAARGAARDFRSIVILKGSPTATATPEGDVVLNTSGNPGMATAGSGDVLAGIIGALVGQGAAAFSAAWSSVFLHGLAGDLAARKYGERGLMALDVAANIPAAMKMVDRD